MPIVLCKTCKKEFSAKPSWIKKGDGKYCSLACSRIGHRTGLFVDCYECKKHIYKQARFLNKSKSKKFFCSKQCHLSNLNASQIGEKGSNWKHGRSSYRGIILRSSVLRKCLICKNEDKRVLLVHHVDHNRKNNKINNLSWLCSNCHFLVHHYKDVEEKFILKLKNDKE